MIIAFVVYDDPFGIRILIIFYAKVQNSCSIQTNKIFCAKFKAKNSLK